MNDTFLKWRCPEPKTKNSIYFSGANLMHGLHGTLPLEIIAAWNYPFQSGSHWAKLGETHCQKHLTSINAILTDSKIQLHGRYYYQKMGCVVCHYSVQKRGCQTSKVLVHEIRWWKYVNHICGLKTTYC